MKTKVIRFIVGLAMALSLVGVVNAVTTPAPASAIVGAYKNSCKSSRPQYIYHGFNGHGDRDIVNRCEWSELAWVGSTHVPAHCELRVNDIVVAGRKGSPYYHNWYLARPYASVETRC